MATDKRVIFFFVYSAFLSILGYKLHSSLLPKEEEKPDYFQVEIQPSSYQDLLREKAGEKFLQEQQIDGLLIHNAYYGEREELEKYIRIRRREVLDDIDLSSLSDLTTPFRFWVNSSKLFFKEGPKPFLSQSSRAHEDPAVLVM